MRDNGPHKETSLTSATDDAILAGLATLVQSSRRVESELVAHVGEADARRLYAREAFPSMFAYCTESLHLSEAEAYLRITVARASRAHPVLLTMLADGRLHLSGIARLAPHLTLANRTELLRQATHKSKRQILELIADLAPRPDAPTTVRRLPERRAPGLPGSTLCPDAAGAKAASLVLSATVEPSLVVGSTAPDPAAAVVETSSLCPDRVDLPLSSAPVVEPLGDARYRVQFTANARLRDKLERLRALMRAEVPDGDLAAVIEKAVTEKIEQIERRSHNAWLAEQDYDREAQRELQSNRQRRKKIRLRTVELKPRSVTS